ncbi:TlpA family protein disulfide reductase [Bacteroides sp. 214]|uniref:peroxiredoxin family protein n=1 Tax=Bacteroides sp. 214 TaxID=2302935 RepID=UPI0013D3501D|nr:TlpA disulfide reductase family protein [Bacteroides sp. 214]NDW12463.1 TlpA family protein disulfide reductase [Bacteroides sp. 214]
MKYKTTTLLILLTIFLFISCNKQEIGIVEIPLNYHEGNGEFYREAVTIKWNSETPQQDDPWTGTQKTIKGIPTDWTETKQGSIILNMYQHVYQNYLSGDITPEWYAELQKSWNWTPDLTQLSDKPLNVTVQVARGIDATGKEMVIIDTNANDDFSDDTPFAPERLANKSYANYKDYIVYATYERLKNGDIVREQCPLLIFNMRQLVYCVPQHATATVNKETVHVNLGFRDVYFKKAALYVPKKGAKKEFDKVLYEDQIQKNEYVEVGRKLYKYLGIDRNRDLLLLENVTIPREDVQSTQIGFKAYPFEGKPLMRENVLSLESLKGKYVYLYFWSTSCRYCMEEVNPLTDLHFELSGKKVEFIGICCDSTEEDLMQAYLQYVLDYPLILSTEENNIGKLYNIAAYPTTFLLDPNGTIIAKGLRIDALRAKLVELGLYEFRY